jgi:hypothetical protein
MEIRNKISLIHRLLKGDSSSHSAVRNFIKRFDLVYFDNIGHLYNDHAVIRGVTASTKHMDSSFATGNIKGRDISILERASSFIHTGKHEEKYNWIIVQVDLKRTLDIPPTFIDSYRYGEIFYNNLLFTYSNLKNAQSLFMAHDPLFNKKFKTFTPSDRFDDLNHVLTSEITSMLAHHFPQFDYELQNDVIYVYNARPAPQEHDIELMARIGLWLADALEK